MYVGLIAIATDVTLDCLGLELHVQSIRLTCGLQYAAAAYYMNNSFPRLNSPIVFIRLSIKLSA